MSPGKKRIPRTFTYDMMITFCFGKEFSNQTKYACKSKQEKAIIGRERNDLEMPF
jgi:hypothetical protein